MEKLKGKVALITGAGRGIGRAIAIKLGAEGARVLVNDLDEESVAETAAAITAAGGECATHVGSVSSSEFAEAFIGQALSRWDGLDIIVNNAGYTWDGVIQKMSDKQFDAMVDVHLKAPFQILRAASEPIRALARRDAERGLTTHRKVVNISSVSGILGNAGQINYAAAKAGVVGMTKTLAKEWGRHRVNVNCVAFGYIQTRLTQAVDDTPATMEVEGRTVRVGIPASALQSLERVIPLGRGGTPEEAAGAVYLLCVPESDYISGQVLVCGGGYG